MKESLKSANQLLPNPQNKTDKAAVEELTKTIDSILRNGNEIQIQRKKEGFVLYEIARIKRLEYDGDFKSLLKR